MISRIQSTRIILGLTTVAAIGGLLFVPVRACACISPGAIFEGQFHVNPESASLSDVRAGVLHTLPIHTPEANVIEVLAQLPKGEGRGGACAKSVAGVRCELTLSTSILALSRIDLSLMLAFDGDGNLSSIALTKNRYVFGFALSTPDR